MQLQSPSVFYSKLMHSSRQTHLVRTMCCRPNARMSGLTTDWVAGWNDWLALSTVFSALCHDLCDSRNMQIKEPSATSILCLLFQLKKGELLSLLHGCNRTNHRNMLRIKCAPKSMNWISQNQKFWIWPSWCNSSPGRKLSINYIHVRNLWLTVYTHCHVIKISNEPVSSVQVKPSFSLELVNFSYLKPPGLAHHQFMLYVKNRVLE